MMWKLRAQWLVVAHDLSEDRYMDDVMETCFLCVVQNGARFWKSLWDYFGQKHRKNLSRSYLQRRKMEKRKHKELFTTWKRLNYKKFSQQLPSYVIATRDSLFCKMLWPIIYYWTDPRQLGNYLLSKWTTCMLRCTRLVFVACRSLRNSSKQCLVKLSLCLNSVIFAFSFYTSNSWHYGCPRSVYCRSIVFLLVV